MIRKYYFDTSFLIAILDKEIEKETVKELFSNILYFSGVGLVELAGYCERNQLNTKKVLKQTQEQFNIVEINSDIAIESTKIRKKQRRENTKFGTMDAIHYASSQAKNCILLTKDSDFRGLKNVEIF